MTHNDVCQFQLDFEKLLKFSAARKVSAFCTFGRMTEETFCGICYEKKFEFEIMPAPYVCVPCKWNMKTHKLRKEERVLAAKTFLQSACMVCLLDIMGLLAFRVQMEWSLGTVLLALFYYLLLL